MKLKKVTVIGLGYVGFPLACAIAKSGKYEEYVKNDFLDLRFRSLIGFP